MANPETPEEQDARRAQSTIRYHTGEIMHHLSNIQNKLSHDYYLSTADLNTDDHKEHARTAGRTMQVLTLDKLVAHHQDTGTPIYDPLVRLSNIIANLRNCTVDQIIIHSREATELQTHIFDAELKPEQD